MTRDEAYALLVNTVNKESYASAVESYRASHNIKMSQAQFDALTSFVYNHGPGVLSTQYGYMTVLLNAVDPSDIDDGPVSGTINNTDVDLNAVPVYSTPGVPSALPLWVMGLQSRSQTTKCTAAAPSRRFGTM